MATYITYLILCVLLVLAVEVSRKPGIALALVWSMFALEQVLQSQFGILLQYSWLVNVGIGLCCLMGVAKVFTVTQFNGYQFPNQFGLFVGLFLMATLSYIWCVDPAKTLSELKENAPQIITFGIFAPLCVYRPKELNTAVKVMVFLGGLILLGMYFSNIGHRGLVLGNTNANLETMEANSLAASQFAGYVTICAVFSIYGRKSNFGMTVLKIGISLLALVLIVRSGSRGQLISLVITCFICLPFAARVAAKRSTILALAFGCIVIVGGLLLINEETWGARWNMASVSAASGGRFARNAELFDIYFDGGPLTWIAGLGSSASYKLVGGYPHNVPNEILTEEGLVGFGLFLALLLYTVRDALAAMKSITSPTDRVNAGILLALFCYDLLLSLKQGSLVSSVPLFSFAVTLGWIAILLRKASAQNRYARQIGWRTSP